MRELALLALFFSFAIYRFKKYTPLLISMIELITLYVPSMPYMVPKR